MIDKEIKSRKKGIIIAIGIAAIIILIIISLASKKAAENQLYEKAKTMMDYENYEEAIECFEKIKNRDVDVEIKECKYCLAIIKYEEQNYEEASDLFRDLQYKKSEEYLTKCTQMLKIESIAKLGVGESFTFGHYYKDHESDNMESIEWVVLKKESDKALVITKKAIDCLPYDDSNNRDATWENCSLRKWMNEDFYETAFEEEFKDAICVSSIPYTEYDIWDKMEYTFPDRSIEDCLFLLSALEANEFIGEEKDNRVCGCTEYAFENGAFRSILFPGTHWWLRTVNGVGNASYVDCIGYFSDMSMSLELSVRPAMWLRF